MKKWRKEIREREKQRRRGQKEAISVNFCAVKNVKKSLFLIKNLSSKNANFAAKKLISE